MASRQQTHATVLEPKGDAFQLNTYFRSICVRHCAKDWERIISMDVVPAHEACHLGKIDMCVRKIRCLCAVDVKTS